MAFVALLFLGAGLGNSIAFTNLNHPHRSVGCKNCHGFQTREAASDSLQGQKPAATAQCLECHATDLQKPGFAQLFHQRGEDCERCHSFHNPQVLVINGDSTDIEVATAELYQCSDCHQTTTLPEVSAGHQEAAKLLHGDTRGLFRTDPSAFCLACHDYGAVPQVTSNLRPPQLHMEASHPYDIRIIPGYRRAGSSLKLQDQLDPMYRLVDEKMTCITCHSLASTNAQLVVATIDKGLCTGCHDMQRPDGSFAALSLHKQVNN